MKCQNLFSEENKKKTKTTLKYRLLNFLPCMLCFTIPDQQLNMQELYVSQAELRRVQAEIEEMKHKVGTVRQF